MRRRIGHRRGYDVTRVTRDLEATRRRGVPFLLKDLAAGNRAGDPIHWGTRFLKQADFRATTTSYLVQRFLVAARRDGDHYILSGSKTCITNAPYGDVYLVYAKNEEDDSIQAFIAERCFEIARDYAKERVQGGHAIANYQLVQNRLARMYVALSNARRFVHERGDVSILDACAGKLYVAEVGTFVAHEAIHILGGYGYLEEQTVERLARDAKLLELGGGTTEIQILTIARHILA
jgi:alkylation response protein AidB-like acyl-CoA dehydrogenase